MPGAYAVPVPLLCLVRMLCLVHALLWSRSVCRLGAGSGKAALALPSGKSPGSWQLHPVARPAAADARLCVTTPPCVPLLVPSPPQVGASNELPESEELDALYDRFLLRRQVSQVSQAGLLEMLSNGGGRKQVRCGRRGVTACCAGGACPCCGVRRRRGVSPWGRALRVGGSALDRRTAAAAAAVLCAAHPCCALPTHPPLCRPPRAGPCAA